LYIVDKKAGEKPRFLFFLDKISESC